MKQNVGLAVVIMTSLLLNGCGWFSKPAKPAVAPIAPPPIVKPIPPDYYLCPDAKAVMMNTNSQIWIYQGLEWSLDQMKWGIGSQLTFMQASIVNQNNSLSCFYRWPNPNPNQPGTSLWMSILLNPEANQVIKPYGQHWHTSDDQKGVECQSALPQTCAFKLVTVTS